MKNKWKIAAAATLLAASIASPAFAQAFDATYGTGNPMPTYYDHDGALHLGTPAEQNRVVVHRNGSNAFAMVPGGSSSEDSPAATGGGSSGYNESLRTNQW